MFNKVVPISFFVLLSACGAIQAPSYEKNKKPEDREQYSGVEGMVQYQKDQSYLASKELSDKCTKAKIDLAIARENKQVSEAEKQASLVNSTCI